MLMKKWVKIVLIIVGIFIVLFAVNAIFFNKQKTLTATSFFITDNPLDLSQIKSISKFRSCEGHNFSGYNADGEEETYRTMKHYVEAIDELAQTTQRVKIFAPFDGKVSQIAKDPRGSQVYLSPKSGSNGWDILFFHVDLLPQFSSRGTVITSGEHIGYANLENAANFDISLRNFGLKQLNDSPFFYMTENVLSEYSLAGVTLDNIITSKEERDISPCQLAPGESGRDAFYARSESGKSWVDLEQK